MTLYGSFEINDSKGEYAIYYDAVYSLPNNELRSAIGIMEQWNIGIQVHTVNKYRDSRAQQIMERLNDNGDTSTRHLFPISYIISENFFVPTPIWILLDGHKNISYCESEIESRFPEKYSLIIEDTNNGKRKRCRVNIF